MDVGSLLSQAGDPVHLNREKAITSLEEALSTKDPKESKEIIEQLQNGVLTMARSDQWEQRLGAMRIAGVLISSHAADPAFLENAIEICSDRLEDAEVRVRLAVGQVLKALSAEIGTVVWEKTIERILSSIRENFDRDLAEPSSTTVQGERDQRPDSPSLVASLLQQTYRVERPGTGEMRHGTEGWKCLETSFRALQGIMEGCGATFAPYLTPELRALIYKALLHPNRFVREACHYILGSVCQLLEGPELETLGPEIANKLGLGLSDNWSQVRYAASVATRTFLLAAKPYHEIVLPMVLPHICLNRYYVAEGVRLYSQETWQLIMGDQGRLWVAKCAPTVVSYYVEQSKANNHAVREAACASIAELMCKVDKEAVAPHVPRLLRALLMCFRDASWPVRDAACLACGRCVLAFPDESKEVLAKLYDLWFAHLWDNIFSVREDSAIALANAARAYGPDAISRIVAKITEMLPKAKDQPADSKARGNLENTTLFGVAAERSQRANDQELHTDKTMFSCGSLAPKLQRGGGGGDGCMDHGFARDKEPWEATDGCIYMIRELAGVAPDQVPQFLPGLAEAARLTHFNHCLNLQETLWRNLPEIAKGIGKKSFKPYLEEFLQPVFQGLRCGHRLCEAAAGQCIGKLRDLIGPGIFEGRLDDDQKILLHTSSDIPPPQGPLSGMGLSKAPVGAGAAGVGVPVAGGIPMMMGQTRIMPPPPTTTMPR
ncbi:hypothetical protein NADE_003012 [Nannochloris sp. 'desiccata']|nr:hypothetical protein KSW81_000931 [Chlorella desiccata (nom. nud.)]KAH7620389.1 hypothetical protein NADE_003012 [Chlorella desiccata (nom. nud.)]